jgi:hypothetical protein
MANRCHSFKGRNRQKVFWRMRVPETCVQIMEVETAYGS